MSDDPRLPAIPDIHGHAKGEHKPFAEERPIPYTARMLFLWFFHAARRGSPRFLMVADHVNYLTFEDPAAVNLVRRALKLAQAGDLYGASETAGVEVGHAAVVSEGLRRGMRFSIGAEVDNDPRNRPDAQNIVDAMRPDGLVRSIHFLAITHPQHGENWQWAFDNPEFASLYETVGGDRVWEMYADALFDALEKQPTNIVAHFYVPAKFGHWPADDVLERYEDRLIELCAEHGIAIEVNSRYLYKFYVDDPAQLERYRTAHLRLLRKAKARGVAVAVGSDAHSPKDQGRAFEAVLELLDEVGINDIAFPLSGRLAHVALRSTDDREPEPAKAAEHLAGAADVSRAAGVAAPADPAGPGGTELPPADAAERAATEPAGTAPPETARPARKPRPSRAKPKPAADAPAPDAAAPDDAVAAAASDDAASDAVETAPVAAAMPPPVEEPDDAPVAEPVAPGRASEAPQPPDERPASLPPAADPSGPMPPAVEPPDAKPPEGKAVAAKGGSAKPPAAKPSGGKVPAGKAAAAKPAPAKPKAAAAKAAAAKPGAGSVARQPAAKASKPKPVAAKPGAKPPAKSAAKKPAPARPAAKKAAAKPAARGASVRKGSAKAPAAKKSSAKRR